MRYMIIDILADLKNNYGATGIKAEFEEEGLSFDEVLKHKEAANSVLLDLSVKIGGCGALNDIKNLKIMGVKTIICPMVESSYALRKYIKSIKAVYDKDEIQKLHLFINIETKTGINSLGEILSLEDANYIEGIILGRSDTACSLNIEKSEINENYMLDIAKDVAVQAKKCGKKFAVGGGIFEESVSFLQELNKIGLDYFETRKIIFPSSILENNKATEGINRALEFEIIWLKSIKNPLPCEIKRIKCLENKIKKCRL